MCGGAWPGLIPDSHFIPWDRRPHHLKWDYVICPDYTFKILQHCIWLLHCTDTGDSYLLYHCASSLPDQSKSRIQHCCVVSSSQLIFHLRCDDDHTHLPTCYTIQNYSNRHNLKWMFIHFYSSCAFRGEKKTCASVRWAPRRSTGIGKSCDVYRLTIRPVFVLACQPANDNMIMRLYPHGSVAWWDSVELCKNPQRKSTWNVHW